MARLIDANDLIKVFQQKLENNTFPLCVIDTIEDAPTIDPVKHGMKVYVVVNGNYVLSDRMYIFSSRELAYGFKEHLKKEFDDGIVLNVFELELDGAVLREEDL